MKRSNHLLLATLAASLALGAISAFLPERARPEAAEPRSESRPAPAELVPLLPVGARTAAEVGVQAADATGFYSLPEGRSFELSFTSSFSADVLQAEAASGARIELALEGTLSVLVLQGTESELVLRVSPELSRVEASASGSGAPADYQATLRGELARPALVRMDRGGRVIGYAFGDDVRPEHENLVRTLLFAMRFSIDEDHDDEAHAPDNGKWLVDETDSTGPCLVEYEWTEPAEGGATARRIARTKLAYDQLAVAPRILSSHGEGRMSLELRWPLDGRHEERLELPLDDAGTTVRVENELTFVLVHHDMVPRGSLPRVDPLIAWESAGGEGAAARTSELARGLELAAETATLEAVLGTIEAQLAADLLASHELHDSQRLLAELIRRDARQLERLRTYLPGLAPKVGMVVLAAVGLAGTTEAQAFLAGVLGDEAETDELRLYANLAAHQVERPTPALIEALTSVTLQPESARNLRSSALLALGSMAGQAEPGLQGAILTHLLEHSGLGASADDLVILLEALGNCGNSRILPVVAEHLEHADERVRLSAVSALRFLEPELARAHLTAALHDASTRVRAAAAELLASQDSPQANLEAERFLAGETSSQARARAARDAR